MNKKIPLGGALAMMLLVAAVTFNITFDFVNSHVNDRMIDLREREEALEKFSMLNRYVRANFNGVIDEVYLMDSVARGFLAGIGDPHAVYHDARAFENILRAQGSPAAGIGAALRAAPESHGYIYVDEVFVDSPALAAGIQPGDLIIRVDEVDLNPANSLAMLEALSGEQGTSVLLTIRSENMDREESLIRRIVPVPSVHAQILDGTQTGYIIIHEFNQHTPDHFRRERDRLISDGVQSLIFDVRDTAGGELSYLARTLDQLIPAGIIISARSGYDNDEVMFTGSGPGLDMPMVVIQNEGTSGAAEMFGQVLMDYGRAHTVGTQSAGVGVMQELIPLVDGSAIEITVAHLVSPAGVMFDGVGVSPNYSVSFDEDWRGLGVAFDPQLRRGLELAEALEAVVQAQAQDNIQAVAVG